MVQTAVQPVSQTETSAKTIKCVVWDLDNTIWNGVLLENDVLELRPEVVETIQELDRRGILHSIASRNDEQAARRKLEEFGLAEYFLYPQIGWHSKSESIAAIAKDLNIGVDTLAFVDDQPFEREEVAFAHPAVLTIDVHQVRKMRDMPRMNPPFITSESHLRRRMYRDDANRLAAEKAFDGRGEQFLATLNMVFRIAPAGEADLQRAEELTLRTNQLNTTGYTYSYEELDRLRQSADHLLLIASLEDRFGAYGTIGLALVETSGEAWTVLLLLMSCRVMSRGVGTIMMSYIMQRAKSAGKKLWAHFVPNGRNRMMYATYKFGGFEEVGRSGEATILEHGLDRIQPFPSYVEVHVPAAAECSSTA